MNQSSKDFAMQFVYSLVYNKCVESEISMSLIDMSNVAHNIVNSSDFQVGMEDLVDYEVRMHKKINNEYLTNKQMLINEIIHNLPSKKIYQVVSNLAVLSQEGKLMLIKNRYDKTNYSNGINIPVDKYQLIKEFNCNMYHDYEELIGKFVIIPYHLLSIRGQKAIQELELLN